MPKGIREVDDAPLDELRREDIRLRIAGRVGLNPKNSDSAFGLANLNAIHGYLAGEHAFPKELYNTQLSPAKHTVRRDIAHAIDMETYSGVRPFRRSELITICEAVEDQGDKRPSPDPRGGEDDNE